MSKHLRPDKPTQPNQILHTGARPLPDGNIEMMVIVRLDDCNYQFQKIVSVDEYQIILEGLDLCARTAIHQIRQRAMRDVQDQAPEQEAVEGSSPKSGSVPPAIAERFTGGSME